MKRFFIFILALLYLTTSSGLTFHVHYCMGEWVEATLIDNNSKDNHECSYCGMTKTAGNGCCKDEQKIVKIDQVHHAAHIVFELLQPISTDIAFSLYHLDILTYPETKNELALNHAPPLHRSCAIYIQNRNFRI